MNGKAYSLERLSLVIDTAEKYIHDPTLRKRILSKCHQEIGLVVVEAPAHQRAAIVLSQPESAALRNALITRRLEREKLQSR